MCRVSMAAVVVVSEDCCCVLVVSDWCRLIGDCLGADCGWFVMWGYGLRFGGMGLTICVTDL